MADEFETIELEYSEDDILYYIEDEDGTEIGFALEEDGKEVEYYYEGFNADDYETVSAPEAAAEKATDTVAAPVKEEAAEPIAASATEEAAEPVAAPAKEEPVEHGYLYKMAAIVGHEGNKTRKAAGEKLDVVRGKAEVQYGKAKKVATEQAGKAKTVVSEQAGKAKAKADEMDLGITREGVAETTADLNAIAKEGAETVKELKEAYDDIIENFGFLVPKKIKRRLP